MYKLTALFSDFAKFQIFDEQLHSQISIEFPRVRIAPEDQRPGGTVNPDGTRLWCKCSAHPGGGRWVSRKTYYRHRRADIALNEFSTAGVSRRMPRPRAQPLREMPPEMESKQWGFNDGEFDEGGLDFGEGFLGYTVGADDEEADAEGKQADRDKNNEDGDGEREEERYASRDLSMD